MNIIRDKDGKFVSVSIQEKIGERYPDLKKYLQKEESYSINLDEILSGSHLSVITKATWKCSNCPRKYIMSINGRLVRHIKGINYCQVCSSIQKTGSFKSNWPNHLVDYNIKRNKLGPGFYRKYDSEVIHWKCHKCKHEFTKSIHEKVRGIQPITKRYGTCDNCRSFEYHFPELIEEIDFEQTKCNHNLSEEDIKKLSPAAHNLIVWKCLNINCQHQWEVPLYYRTSLGYGCQKCGSQYQTSYFELKWLRYIREYLDSYTIKHKFKPFENSNYEADIYIQELKAAIEIDGYFSHIDRKEEDRKKDELFRENNMKVLRIRARGLNRLNEYDLINVSTNEEPAHYLNELFANLKSLVKQEVKLPNKEVNTLEYLSNKAMLQKYIEENSIINIEEVNNLFDSKKNDFKAEELLPWSEHSVWFKCNKCRHEFKEPVKNIVRRKNKCQKCPREFSRKELNDIEHQFITMGKTVELKPMNLEEEYINERSLVKCTRNYKNIRGLFTVTSIRYLKTGTEREREEKVSTFGHLYSYDNLIMLCKMAHHKLLSPEYIDRDAKYYAMNFQGMIVSFRIGNLLSNLNKILMKDNKIPDNFNPFQKTIFSERNPYALVNLKRTTEREGYKILETDFLKSNSYYLAIDYNKIQKFYFRYNYHSHSTQKRARKISYFETKVDSFHPYLLKNYQKLLDSNNLNMTILSKEEVNEMLETYLRPDLIDKSTYNYNSDYLYAKENDGYLYIIRLNINDLQRNKKENKNYQPTNTHNPFSILNIRNYLLKESNDWDINLFQEFINQKTSLEFIDKLNNKILNRSYTNVKRTIKNKK